MPRSAKKRRSGRSLWLITIHWWGRGVVGEGLIILGFFSSFLGKRYCRKFSTAEPHLLKRDVTCNTKTELKRVLRVGSLFFFGLGTAESLLCNLESSLAQGTRSSLFL